MKLLELFHESVRSLPPPIPSLHIGVLKLTPFVRYDGIQKDFYKLTDLEKV